MKVRIPASRSLSSCGWGCPGLKGYSEAHKSGVAQYEFGMGGGVRSTGWRQLSILVPIGDMATHAPVSSYSNSTGECRIVSILTDIRSATDHGQASDFEDQREDVLYI